MAFGIKDGRAVVAAAATANRVASSALSTNSVIISAETDNTGIIAIGNSTVVAAEGTQRGVLLLAGDMLPPLFDVDLYDLWIDATVTGDGISYLILA